MEAHPLLVDLLPVYLKTSWWTCLVVDLLLDLLLDLLSVPVNAEDSSWVSPSCRPIVSIPLPSTPGRRTFFWVILSWVWEVLLWVWEGRLE